MSYLNHTHDPRRRNTAIAGVAAIHALLGYALVTGLAYDVIKPIIDRTPIIDFPVPPDPPKPPPPDASVDPVVPDAPVTAPKPPIRLPDKTSVDVVKFDPTVVIDRPIVRVPLPTASPSPLPSPSFTARAAVPENDPADWVRTEDYPSRALRQELEGTTRFRLVIGSNGRVNACEVTGSSGHQVLDEATCKFVSRRARFEPATDGNGAAVVGTYTSSVRWVLPRR